MTHVSCKELLFLQRAGVHGTDSTKSLSLLNSLDASIHLENNVSAHMIDSANINALDHMML